MNYHQSSAFVTRKILTGKLITERHEKIKMLTKRSISILGHHLSLPSYSEIQKAISDNSKLNCAKELTVNLKISLDSHNELFFFKQISSHFSFKILVAIL